MGGLQQARETADRLKKEATAAAEKDKKEKVEAEKSLVSLQQNPAMVRLYQENAKVGADNLTSRSPLLKIHTTGRSQSELSDGTEPTDGYFFYAPSQEQFKDVDCHILTISKGFRAPGMEGSGKSEVFNQVMAGVITNGGELKPFIMYMTGLKLSPMWDFGKEVSKYTHAKPVPVPMFALKVKLTTEKVKNNFGKSWIVKFDVVKNESGQPLVVADPGQFEFLRTQVESFETTIASLIEARKVEDRDDETPHPADVVGDAEEIFGAKAEKADKMPF